jgi:integrase
MARQRHVRGRGTVYKEEKPERKTRWVAEKYVRLPDGRKVRIRARARIQEEALEELDRKIAAAKKANPAADKQTVDAFMVRWLEHKKANVRASTHYQYERDHALHIKPKLGGIKLSRLTAYQVQRVLTDIQSAGHHAMADRVRRTLKQALRQAVKWDLLSANPLDKLDPIRRRPVKRGVWTPEEIRRFLKEAESSPYYLAFVLGIATGMRKGEILALTWGDVGGSRVSVSKTVSKRAEGGIAPPKTAAGERKVRVTPDVERLILSHRNGETDSDPIFPGRGTRRSRLANPRTLSRELDRLIGVAKVPEIRFHDLRRTYATMLALQGAHPKVIQKALGHSTPTLAMQIYTDVLEEQEERAVIEMPGGMPGGSGGEPEHTDEEVSGASEGPMESDSDRV